MLTISTGVAVIAMMLITQIVKKYIAPKWGETGVHAFVFVLALCYVCGQAILQANPGALVVAERGLALLSATVGIYEIFLKKITG